MERTVSIVKPDGVERGLLGEVLRRYENMGLRIADCIMVKADEETLKKHYVEHKDKVFYKSLVEYMTRGKILVMIIEGKNAISLVRKANGLTDPTVSAPGTIRGDFAFSKTENIVHGSDSPEAARREIEIWF